MIESGHSLYTGKVSHARLTEKKHSFTYRLSMICLDLERLDNAFSKRWLWSLERPNIVYFRRRDYLPGGQENLAEAARDLVENTTAVRPGGRIMIMTQPRYFGICFNPVSLYFCHNHEDQLSHVIAEVHNTPWNERLPYVLEIPGTTQGDIRVDFDKELHVSPFMAMDMQYRFRLFRLNNTLRITLENHQAGKRIFTAGMQLQPQPLNAAACLYALTATPLMTLKIVGAIYWQALRLWMKGVPFVAHTRANALKTRFNTLSNPKDL